MKKHFAVITVCSLAIVMTAVNGFCIDKDTGLGIIVGEPTGICGKIWKDNNTAIAGAVAWSFVEKSYLHLHGDWLHHNWTLLREHVDIETGELPLYYGIGGRIRLEDELRAGVRFVIGIDYIFKQAPFDIFFEIAPIMDVVPEMKINGNSAIGVRYWF